MIDSICRLNLDSLQSHKHTAQGCPCSSGIRRIQLLATRRIFARSRTRGMEAELLLLYELHES